MIRFVLIGVWVCVVTLISTYSTAYWASNRVEAAPQAEYLVGLEYRKLRLMNVPIVADNEVKGYVVAQFVYTADAETLRKLTIPPESVIIDRAFRIIYDDSNRKFDGVNKKDLDKMTNDIKVAVNKVFGVELIGDVLIDEFNYIDKKDIMR